jgi:hypothetical protein
MNIKEIREWGNFALTLFLAICLPIGGLLLRNQKLELQNDSDAKYQTKAAAKDFQTETNNKLDKLADGIVTVREDLSAIKGQLARKNP